MLETKRLLIIPLTYNQLVKYIENDGSLEKEFNLNVSIREISFELKEVLEQKILPNVAIISKNYLYSTLWTVVLKEQNRMVGDLCFMGEPDNMGAIEIGYGTYDEYRNRGYMTEAVRGMIKWAQEQPDVKSIIASTEKNNIASYSVLLKNCFTRVDENENLLKWKLVI